VKKRNCINAIGLSLAFAAPLFAQPIGVPIVYEQSGQLMVSATGGLARQDLGDDTYLSERYLLRARYGFAKELDLFGGIGIARLRVEDDAPRQGPKPTLAYGGGVHLTFLNMPKAHLLGSITGQVFRFVNRERREEPITIGGERWTQIRESKHDWLEYGGALGVILDGTWLDVYGGYEVLVLDLLRTDREEFRRQGEAASPGGARAIHFDATGRRPFLGVDFALPDRLKISLEVRGTSLADGAVFIGLSQRGSP